MLLACNVLVTYAQTGVTPMFPSRSANRLDKEGTRTPAGKDTYSTAVYDMWVNGESKGEWTLLERGSLLYAPEAVLRQWQLQPTARAQAVEFSGQRWYALIAFEGSEVRISPAEQRIDLSLQVTSSELTSARLQSTSVLGVSASTSSTSSKPFRVLPLEVVLNGANMGSWVFVESAGGLYVNEAAFAEWRLNHRPTRPPLHFRNQRWHGLDEIAGYKAEIDYAAMTLRLEFSAQSFIASEIEDEPEVRPILAPSQWALFANYDLSYTQLDYAQSYSSRELGVLTELGLTGPWGVLTSSFVGRNLGDDTPGQAPSWTRLETRMIRDNPDANTTWSLGDTSTRGGMMTRPVYFGGVQVRRNFALTPGFVTQPMPVLAGTSNSPSTVEVYINDALRQTSKIPTGPFTIQNAMPVTGAGDVRVVVRDVLGRETVVTQSFFSDSSLLAPGLSDWSFELGATRRNLGLSDADYGESFAAGLWRGGMTPAFTLETSAEWSQSLRNVGLGANFTLPAKSVGQAAIALSDHNSVGVGGQWLLSLQRYNLRHGVSLRLDGSTSGYRWLGSPDAPANPWQVAGTYNYAHPEWGSFGISLAQVQSSATHDVLQTMSLSHSIRVGERGALSFSATRYSGPTASGNFVGFTLILPTEGGINYLASLSQQSGRTDAYASAQRGLTTETGAGWRVLTGERGGQFYNEGGVSYQGAQGLVTADASASSSQQSVRLGAQGGLVWMDRHLLATRTLQDSFALVEVPGYADISVGFSGSHLTRTNADGVALLPRLNAYANNAIRLDPSELPINAELDSIEQVVAPAWRSAVKVVFPVRSGRGALLRIVLDDGEPAPAGSEIQLQGDKQMFFVARRGLAFLTGLESHNKAELRWQDGRCALEFDLPPGTVDDISRVGPLICHGVRR